MTLTCIVLADNKEWQNKRIEIGAFAGDECRGTAFLQNVEQIAEHPYMGFLVIYGDKAENIRLRIYDHVAGREYEAENALSFVADAIHGNPSTPSNVSALPSGVYILKIHTDKGIETQKFVKQ
ncbi:MAG: T9SS type A sorting domain-containing protein [Dysgonamonadaceae bacterium]|jgi:hypothetical protein|nr:T9SS type A sorting domain-containing protein [Dysgonamonadaceae bacterium]